MHTKASDNKLNILPVTIHIYHYVYILSNSENLVSSTALLYQAEPIRVLPAGIEEELAAYHGKEDTKY